MIAPTAPMIIGNAIAVGCAIIIVALLSHDRFLPKKGNERIANTFQRWLLACIVIAYLVTSSFTYILQNGMVKIETQDVEYKKGIELVLKQFKDILKSKGVEEIPGLGETFDPALHEAVGSVQDPEKNTQEIVQEYRKGYKIGNRVIRHSMVVVAN